MRFFNGLLARYSGAGSAGGSCRSAARRHAEMPSLGRTRLSIVCHRNDVQAVRRRIHAKLGTIDAEVARVEVTPMAPEGLFNVCFTVAYPADQRKTLMDQVGAFADDESIHRIRFGSIPAV